MIPERSAAVNEPRGSPDGWWVLADGSPKPGNPGNLGSPPDSRRWEPSTRWPSRPRVGFSPRPRMGGPGRAIRRVARRLPRIRGRRTGGERSPATRPTLELGVDSDETAPHAGGGGDDLDVLDGRWDDLSGRRDRRRIRRRRRPARRAPGVGQRRRRPPTSPSTASSTSTTSSSVLADWGCAALGFPDPTLSGTVTNAWTGDPIDGAEVHVDGIVLVTDDVRRLLRRGPPGRLHRDLRGRALRRRRRGRGHLPRHPRDAGPRAGAVGGGRRRDERRRRRDARRRDHGDGGGHRARRLDGAGLRVDADARRATRRSTAPTPTRRPSGLASAGRLQGAPLRAARRAADRPRGPAAERAAAARASSPAACRTASRSSGSTRSRSRRPGSSTSTST